MIIKISRTRYKKRWNVELIRCGIGIGQKGTIFGKIIGIRPD